MFNEGNIEPKSCMAAAQAAKAVVVGILGVRDRYVWIDTYVSIDLENCLRLNFDLYTYACEAFGLLQRVNIEHKPCTRCKATLALKT